MEKGMFGRIRDAVREYTQHGGEEGDYRETLQFFRKLKSVDETILSDAIMGLSGIHEVRKKIGDERYTLFTSVAAEKERRLTPEVEERLSAIEALPNSAETREQMVKLISWMMDTSEVDIRNDERIQEGFLGLEEELDTLISTTKVWMKSFFKSVLLGSMNTRHQEA